MDSTLSPLDSIAPVMSPPLTKQLTISSMGIQGDVNRATETVTFTATVSDSGVGDNPIPQSNTGGSDSFGASMINTVINPPTITGNIGIPSASATTPVVLATPAKPSVFATFAPLLPTTSTTAEQPFSTTLTTATDLNSPIPTEASAGTIVDSSHIATVGGVVGGSLLVIGVVAVLIFGKSCIRRGRWRQGIPAIKLPLPLSMVNSSSHGGASQVHRIHQPPGVLVTVVRTYEGRAPVPIPPNPADRMYSTTRESIIGTCNEAPSTTLPVPATGSISERDSRLQVVDVEADHQMQSLGEGSHMARSKRDVVSDIGTLNPRLWGNGDIMHLDIRDTSDTHSTDSLTLYEDSG